MKVIPAIDIIDGKCVRLTEGDFSRKSIYQQTPLSAAKKFMEAGADFLHIIDLDGAKEGRPINDEYTLEIIRKTGIRVQTGGGIRSFEQAEKLLSGGVARIILSTSALTKPKMLRDLIKKFGTGRIIVSVDVRDGQVALKGWLKYSKKPLSIFLKELKRIGITTIIFTDISRDGRLSGPNLPLIKKIMASGLQIIVAGGVTKMSDLQALNKLGIESVIIGKALYEKTIDLREAISKFSSKNGLAKRIIPCLDTKNGRVVKGLNFVKLRDAGDPVELGRFYSDAGADELVFLDIMASYEERKTLRKLVENIAQNINIPFTVGGGIRSIDDIRALLKAGADKVSLGTAAVKNPRLVATAAKKFGSQCIVISVDAKKTGQGWNVFIRGGRDDTGIDAIEFSRKMEALGAGELLVNSLDRDGTKSGYDLELLRSISLSVNIPVIASSGAGKKKDFLDGFKFGLVDAILAASVFHFGEIKIENLKKYLAKNDLTIRI